MTLDRSAIVDWLWKKGDNHIRMQRDLGSIERNFQRAHINKKFLTKWLSFGPILEIGCGYGKLVNDCLKQELDAKGVDIALREEKIKKLVHEYWQDDPDVLNHIYDYDAASLPFSDQQFGFIASIAGPLSYTMSREDADEILAENLRVLKPGGRFYISFANISKSTDGDFAYIENCYINETHLAFKKGRSTFRDYDYQAFTYCTGWSWDEELQNHVKDGFVILKKL